MSISRSTLMRHARRLGMGPWPVPATRHGPAAARLRRGRGSWRRGSALVEFALVALLLCVVLLAGIELDRMTLVYTTMADCARSGLRYAVVHGALKNGSGADGPSGPGNTAQVETVVRNFAGAGLLDASRLSVSVTYPDGNNHIGSRVHIQVTYPYDPFMALPLAVPLGSQTEGIIAF